MPVPSLLFPRGEHKDLSGENKPRVLLNTATEKTMSFTVLVWVANFSQIQTIKSEVLSILYQRLKEKGIKTLQERVSDRPVLPGPMNSRRSDWEIFSTKWSGKFETRRNGRAQIVRNMITGKRPRMPRCLGSAGEHGFCRDGEKEGV